MMTTTKTTNPTATTTIATNPTTTSLHCNTAKNHKKQKTTSTGAAAQ
jgi:hypothetical protein